MDDRQTIPFTMNYYALKTFGRQQYSNPWAALSELVANGFDADAKTVYLFIDMRDKEHSIIELIDLGSGMSPEDIEKKYVIIGRNRRKDNPKDTATGRKGIGKLAALYLSDVYSIISVKNSTISSRESVCPLKIENVLMVFGKTCISASAVVITQSAIFKSLIALIR